MTGILMGNGTALGIITQSITVASVAANTTAERTFNVPGLRLGDAVFVCKPSLTAGIGIVNARVSATDTLAISYVNATGTPTGAAAESYSIIYLRPEQGNVYNGVVA